MERSCRKISAQRCLLLAEADKGVKIPPDCVPEFAAKKKTHQGSGFLIEPNNTQANSPGQSIDGSHISFDYTLLLLWYPPPLFIISKCRKRTITPNRRVCFRNDGYHHQGRPRCRIVANPTAESLSEG